MVVSSELSTKKVDRGCSIILIYLNSTVYFLGLSIYLNVLYSFKVQRGCLEIGHPSQNL